MGISERDALAAWQHARHDRAAAVAGLEAGVARHGQFYGALGRLTYQVDGSGVQCHLCGRFYRNLGQHVRMRHRMDPNDYREFIGLNRHTALAAPLLQAHLVDRARRLESHRRLTPRHGRGGAPMPPTRLEGRLRESAQAQAQETVAVACPRCGAPVTVPRRRAGMATYCPTCRPRRKRETVRVWGQHRQRSRRGVALPRVVVDGRPRAADCCARCGGAITVAPVRSYRTNYCPSCREVRKRETGRVANARYRERRAGG